MEQSSEPENCRVGSEGPKLRCTSIPTRENGKISVFFFLSFHVFETFTLNGALNLFMSLFFWFFIFFLSLSSRLVPCHFSLFRLPRLLKWHSVETFFLMSDYRTSKPNRLRASKLILYLSVAMHWVACLYYAISEYEGLGTNDWVYTETVKGGDPLSRSVVYAIKS